MGFEWDTTEMTILISAKLGGPLRGKTASILVNSIHIKGDVRVHALSLDCVHAK